MGLVAPRGSAEVSMKSCKHSRALSCCLECSAAPISEAVTKFGMPYKEALLRAPQGLERIQIPFPDHQRAVHARPDAITSDPVIWNLTVASWRSEVTDSCCRER